MDKRIIKSTQKLKEKYLEMMFKIEPRDIQVKDLCLSAGVNRSTFYDRFGFIENLESEIIQEEISNTAFGNVQIDSLNRFMDGINKDIIKYYIENFVNNNILKRFCMVSNREKYVDIMIHKQVELCASNLTKVSYYDAYYQVTGALATIIEWVNHPRNKTIDDIVDIVYEHSKAMFKTKN